MRLVQHTTSTAGVPPRNVGGRPAQGAPAPCAAAEQATSSDTPWGDVSEDFPAPGSDGEGAARGLPDLPSAAATPAGSEETSPATVLVPRAVRTPAGAAARPLPSTTPMSNAMLAALAGVGNQHNAGATTAAPPISLAGHRGATESALAGKGAPIPDTATAASARVENGPGQLEDLEVPGDVQPGISIAGTQTLTEGGAAGVWNVSLNTQPTSPVQVNLQVDPALAVSGSPQASTPPVLVFTPLNWSTPQPIYVSALSDSVAEGFHVATIQTYTSTTVDPNYNAINGDTATIGILDANGPNALDDSAATTEGSSISAIAVLANDSDPHGYPLTISSWTQPTGGAASLNDDHTTFSYVPNSGYSGFDSFTYTVGNGHGQQATATVFVSIDPVNQAPTINPVAAQTSS